MKKFVFLLMIIVYRRNMTKICKIWKISVKFLKKLLGKYVEFN